VRVSVTERRQGYGCPCTFNDDCRSGFCYRRSCADEHLQGVVAAQLRYPDLRHLITTPNTNHTFYGHYTGQSALAGTSSEELEEDFVGAKFYSPHAVADGNQRIRVREKTLEFYSTALSTLSLCLVSSATHTHTHPFNGPFPGLPR